MNSKKSKKHSRKGKSKKNRANENKSDLSKQQESLQKLKTEGFYINASKNSAEKDETFDVNSSKSTTENSYENISESISQKDGENKNQSTSQTSCDNTDECYEELKVKQQELLDKLKNVNDAIANIALIRDNVNSIRVDTLTELYFTRQVRPLLDALNIISFASYNMSNVATSVQTNAFGERKEIKTALKLSYKMIDEVDDIINALGRRLKIFLDTVDNMDQNCPPFDFDKDS